MASKGYTTKAKVEKLLNVSISIDIDEFISAAEKIIDNITGRNFIAVSTAVARLFDGDDTCELLIDDCVSISKVEVGNDCWGDTFTEILSTGSARYYKEPVNNTPITKVILRDRVWGVGKQNCKITAKWGFSTAVPDDISLATTIIASGIYNYNRGGLIQSEKIGNYNVAYSNEQGSVSYADIERAMTILNSYKKLFL